MTIYNQIAENKRKSWLVIFSFIGIIAVLGFLFDYALVEGGYFFVFLAIIVASLTSFGSYFASDKIALTLSGAKEVQKKDEPRLYRTVENLSIGLGITPPPKVYVIEDMAINAFATGRDPKHSSIAVTRGALEKLEDLELEGVIAHELSHIQNYDIRTMTIAVVLVGVISLVAEFFWRISFFGDRKSDRDSRGSGIFVVLAIVGMVLAPILAQLLKLALSRQREFLADGSAALLTRYPDGLASALGKIALDAKPLDKASTATAHLFISNPFKEDSGLGDKLASLFSTHPPIQERIKRLQKM